MGCRVCRARKVKCDGRPNGCRNCERLHLTCVDDNSTTAALPLTLGSIRTYRSCTNCRSSKTKCNGDRPRCSRCVARSMDCVYVGGSVPRWASTIEGPYPRRASNAGVASNSSSPQEQPRTRHDGADADHAMEDPGAAAVDGTDGNVSNHRNDGAKAAAVGTGAALNGSPSRPLRLRSDVPIPPPQPSSAVPSTPVTPSQPQNSLELGAMAWLLADQLPSRRNTRSLVEQYFAHIHPIRCFAFVHKPSFMRQLDAGFTQDDDMALLYIICAHGAKFHVQALGQFGQEPSPSFLRAAGNQWAAKAESILIGKYGRVSMPRLMALVLLHDFHIRLGRYNQALILSGIIIRLAQALRIYAELAPDLLCTDEHQHEAGNGNADLSAVFMESRRRLMWACYTLDAWTTNGSEQLSLLREADIKVQLPCNERNFGLRIPCVTETLGLGHVLRFLPPAIVPARPAENMGIMAYYVRIVALRKKISQYIKNYPSGPGPWQSDSEFSALDADMRHWRRTLPDFVEYSPDTIYARLDSNQLGGLMLIHCTYHDSYLELYKISMPVLFDLGSACPAFPPEHQEVLQALQADCYFHARQVSRLIAEAAEHDVRLLSDSMLPLFLYNSSRIMLYYAGMLIEPSRVDAADRVDEAVAAVSENARLLRDMIPLFPISESFVITVEQWLSKIRMTPLSSVRAGTSDDAATTTASSYAPTTTTERTSPFSSRHSVSAVSEFALAPMWASGRRSLAYAASDRPAASRPLASPSSTPIVEEKTATALPSSATNGQHTPDENRGWDHTGAAEQLLGLSGQTTPVDKSTPPLPTKRGACGSLTIEDLQVFSSWDVQSIVDDATSLSGSGTEATRTNVTGWNGQSLSRG